MFNEQRNSRFVLVILVVALLVSLGGCGPRLTPTPLPSPTLMPLTSTSAPTSTPILSATPMSPIPPPALTLERQPTVEVVKVGQDVAIVAKIEPLQKVDLRWRVTGTSGGKVYPETGDAVIYTAGSQPGTDVVTAEGTTAGGAPIKQSTSFKVEPLPTPTPTITLSPTLTPTPTPRTPTATPSNTPRPAIAPPPVAPVSPTCSQWTFESSTTEGWVAARGPDWTDNYAQEATVSS